MFKSIFSKQFSAYMLTLIISFSVLGLTLTNLFRGYFINQKTTEMTEQGETIAQSYIDYYYYRSITIEGFGPIFIPTSDSTLRNDLDVLYKYYGVNCFIIDYEMIVKARTPGIPSSISVLQIVETDEFLPVLNGEIITLTGDLGGIFDETVLTIGYPIKFNDGTIVGAIFMNTSFAEVEKTTGDVIRITVYCLLASLAVLFIIVYLTSKTISKPIHQINEAAKVISDGNFEKRLNIKSVDEIGQLAASFNNMAASLDNHERNRSEFIANISHDLRSPLTSMRGFLAAIIDGTIPAEKTDRYLNIVLDETDRLSKLTNDILTFNKIGNKQIKLNREDFDVNELLRKSIIMFETKINEKGINVEINFEQEKSIVNADFDAIQRVILNLTDNAVKFAPERGKISLKTYTKSGKTFVSIKDDGRGISLEEQKRIFERFYKADASRGEDKKGSGLGLAIVKEFIKAHGEGITVESMPGQGCEFIFSLKNVSQ